MKGLDHLVLAVHDLDAAVEQYKSLGFTVTPRAKHPFGTHNCLIQLDGFFLEILMIGEPEKLPKLEQGTFSFPNFNKQYLENQQGPSMLVMDTDDFRADKIQAEKDGLQSWPVFEFSRQTTLPTGDTATVSFGLNFITNPQMPNAAFFTCQQFAPQYFWKKDYQTHINTAKQISEITLVSDTPHNQLDFLCKFSQSTQFTTNENSIIIHTSRGNIACRTPADFEIVYGQPAAQHPSGPQIGGFIVEVADISKAKTATSTICGAAIKFIQKDITQ